jgi:hypothetical protein
MSGLGTVRKRKSYPCGDLNTKGNLLRITTHPFNLQFSLYFEVIDFQSPKASSVYFSRNLQQYFKVRDAFVPGVDLGRWNVP